MRIGLLSGSVLYPLAGAAGVAENVHSSAANVRITEEIATQTDLYVRAANARHYDRGNLAAEITFETVRTFSTLEAAEAWACDYSETYPRTGTLIIDSSERNGYASQIVVSGGTYDGTPLVWTAFVYDGIVNGRPKFAASTSVLIYWDANDEKWVILNPDETEERIFESADDVASPELVTTWTQLSLAAGPIVVTATYPGRRYMSNAIVHPPVRSLIGVAVFLSYRVTGAAIETTQADADAAWQDEITADGDNWED
jgi:hypothetical protein